ncbi:MAG TPA: TetR/AcrR family transcriptional regulator [Deinococcales bacterium]|nr:TetR/AcrR family transcriptional regulator [Deinococcales bacterium]
MEESVPRREQIYRAAGRLFSEVGYHATSMRDLAKALGVQGGSLYAHITSKEELLWEIVNRAADEFDAALAPVLELQGTPPERITAALEAHLEVVSRNLDWATVFFHEWKHLSAERLELVASRRDSVERVYRALLEEGVRQGHFRADLDVKVAAVLLLSSANWAYHWFDPRGRLTAREVARSFANMILRGFLAQPPR